MLMLPSCISRSSTWALSHCHHPLPTDNPSPHHHNNRPSTHTRLPLPAAPLAWLPLHHWPDSCATHPFHSWTRHGCLAREWLSHPPQLLDVILSTTRLSPCGNTAAAADVISRWRHSDLWPVVTFDPVVEKMEDEVDDRYAGIDIDSLLRHRSEPNNRMFSYGSKKALYEGKYKSYW